MRCVYAYAQAKRLRVEHLDLEYDTLASRFKTVSDIVNYLVGSKIKIDCQPSKNVFAYAKFKEPETKTELSVRYGAVMGRFPLSNSIYNDYTLLEKKNLTHDAVSELLRVGKIKKAKKKNKKGEKPAPTDVSIRWDMVKKARLIHIFPDTSKPGAGKNAKKASGKGGGK